MKSQIQIVTGLFSALSQLINWAHVEAYVQGKQLATKA